MHTRTRQLWIKYDRHREADIRRQLLAEYTHLVKYVVGRFAMTLPRSVDPNDLAGAAVIGLMEAIDGYDPKRGAKFESYALPRIRGAVLDQMRSMDWAPRSLRRKARVLEQAMQHLEATLGRPPDEREVADYLDVDLETYRSMLLNVNTISFVSLDEPLYQDEGGRSTVQDVVEDPNAIDPSRAIEDEDTRVQLTRAIEHLPERKRLVIALYYYEKLTLKEIGQVLGVTESRVCQIHTEAILFLRGKLNHVLQSEVTGVPG